jgi:hypothetical protein
LVWFVTEYKYWFWPKRFRVVEEGQIYRGGWQTPVMLRRILRNYRIKTLLNVACKPSEPEAAGEGAVVRDEGVDWHKILMPGTGLATLPQLDEAADILADSAHRPIFIHCAAGVHRTNMSLAAYRLKYCGWTLAAVFDEMAKCGYAGAIDKDKEDLLTDYVEYLSCSPAPRPLTCPIATGHPQADKEVNVTDSPSSSRW